ncbi:MAG: DsrE family protein [Gemmatimonadota bacterium]|nr:DsrE family protein [Gemmatimonadota bacterium]
MIRALTVCVALLLAHLPADLEAQLPAAAGSTGAALSPREPQMPQKILVHLTHGPEHPTRAALAFAVAKAALDEGHSVSLFLAGDAGQLIRKGVIESLAGLGTGNLGELYRAIVAGGGRFYLSGGSSRARGVTEQDLAGKPAEFAGPPQLVRLSLEHERMFTY